MQRVAIGQVKEVQYIGIPYRIDCTLQRLTMGREIHYTGLVAALQQPCKQQGVDLTLQGSDTPTFSFRLDLIEQALRPLATFMSAR